MLKILEYPNPLLKQAAKPVGMPTPALKKLIEQMIETCDNTPETVGLAAPQIGVSKRVIVVLLNGQWTYMINPKVYGGLLMMQSMEECLSCPGLRKIVGRFQQIKVDYVDLRMQKHTIELFRNDAICVQHEVDHLNGVTLYDKPGQEVSRKTTD